MQLISFGGTQLYRPGAYSSVNLQSNSPVTPGAFKVLAVVGSAAAGQPAVPLYYNNPGLAANALGGTDAVLLANIAWEHGADLICFALTDTATAASYAVLDTTGVPVTLATLKGKRWNTADNQLKITVAAAASGAQAVTLTDTSVTPNVSETYSVADTAQGWVDFVTKINAQSSLVTAVLGTAGTAPATTTNIAATVSTAASFAGGTRSVATPTTISAAIDALKTEDVQGVLTTLTDSTTLSAIQAHVTTMSNVQNRRERRAFIGQPVGTLASAYVTAEASYKSSRMTLVGPGMYRAVNGGKVLLSSAFTAAAIAGRWAGKTNPNDPVTGDFVNALGLEFVWMDEVQSLVQAQVTVVEAIPKKGYGVVQALTGDAQLYELSVADLVDVMTRSLRDQMQAKFVGKAGYNGVVTDMNQFALSTLESFKKQNWLVDSTDAFGQPLPAYRNVTVTKAGTQYAVSAEICPSEPINFVTISATVNL